MGDITLGNPHDVTLSQFQYDTLIKLYKGKIPTVVAFDPLPEDDEETRNWYIERMVQYEYMERVGLFRDDTSKLRDTISEAHTQGRRYKVLSVTHDAVDIMVLMSELASGKRKLQ